MILKIEVPGNRTSKIKQLTSYRDISMSVEAMKAGAVEFLTKPLREQDVLDAVHVALERASQQSCRHEAVTVLRASFKTLTDREREVMALVVTGLSNRQISSELGTREVTVKVHRHNLMAKLGVRSVAQLVRVAAGTSAAARGAQARP